MKKLLTNFKSTATITVVAVLAVLQSVNAQITVSGSNGADGDYATFTTAATGVCAAINGADQAGMNIVIKITGDVTEPGTWGAGFNHGNWTSLTIYPTATATISSTTGPIISFDGADNVVLDGRLRDGSGNVIGASSLTIQTSSTTAVAVRLKDDATNNIIKYCTLKGASTGSNGILIFGGTTVTVNGLGNSNNKIQNNVFTAYSNSSRPKYGIYADGSNTFPNINNEITNNEFKDLLHSGGSSSYLYFNGGSSVSVFKNGAWKITGNSFYESTAITPNATGFFTFITMGLTNSCVGSGNEISGNYFGGTQAQCGGGNFTKGYVSTKDNNFNAIIALIAAAGENNIKNNTFKNIEINNGATKEVSACYVRQGNVNFEGNTVENFTLNGNTVDVLLQPFRSVSAGTITLKNNVFKNLTCTNSTADKAGSINCIDVASPLTATGNVLNGINSSSATSAATQLCVGIRSAGTGSNTINGNFISNFVNNSTAATAYTAGINIQADGVNDIVNNIITLGNNNSSSPIIYGINEGTARAANKNTTLYHNTININGTGNSTAGSYCFYSISTANTRTLKNNIFVNTRGNSSTGINYAIGAQYVADKLVIDYNDYYVSGFEAYIGQETTAIPADKVSLTEWAQYTTQDAASISINPGFADANGTTPASFLTSSGVTLNALAGTVATDFEGVTRTNPTRMGAFNSTSLGTGFDNSVANTAIKILRNSTGIIVPLSENSSIELYSANGLLIEKTQMSSAYARNLANGIYIIRINGKAAKFVK